ncbi:hypothetical protein D9O50_10950 [Oxalobacteraceae bacterium CAVE-383]|nr:hypothetical protein D9O50_10950 [Oxalobacteraceae bacterium CAVE-383]
MPLPELMPPAPLPVLAPLAEEPPDELPPLEPPDVFPVPLLFFLALFLEFLESVALPVPDDWPLVALLPEPVLPEPP